MTNQCSSGKRRFRDKTEAQVEMYRLQAKTDRIPPANVYRCRECGDWHLTSRHPARR